MTITFDLDHVIFNLDSLMAQAFKDSGKEYVRPTSWNMFESYPLPIANKIITLFSDDALYRTPLLDQGIPNILNNLMKRPDMRVLFVTERVLKQPLKTFKQLTNAGIKCDFSQVYDRYGAKSDILYEIHTDLHFDDSPMVVSGCLEKHIPIVMISNETTPYNHHLRNRVEHYENLRTAMASRGLCDLR